MPPYHVVIIKNKYFELHYEWHCVNLGFVYHHIFVNKQNGGIALAGRNDDGTHVRMVPRMQWRPLAEGAVYVKPLLSTQF